MSATFVRTRCGSNATTAKKRERESACVRIFMYLLMYSFVYTGVITVITTVVPELKEQYKLMKEVPETPVADDKEGNAQSTVLVGWLQVLQVRRGCSTCHLVMYLLSEVKYSCFVTKTLLVTPPQVRWFLAHETQRGGELYLHINIPAYMQVHICL